MTATGRLNTEQEFHDSQARHRKVTFTDKPQDLVFADETYFRHETWVQPAFRQLGNLTNLRVLDYGCGHGMAAVVLARHGAWVTALDLSAGYLTEAARRTVANGVAVDFVQGNGEHLPFATNSFDRVWGNAILHHLDMEMAGKELYRILRPGGLAVFCEPWGENPLLNLARRTLPYPHKERTPDECPLRRHHVRKLRQVFPRVELRGFQLLSMVRRILPPGRVVSGLNRCDDLLLTWQPGLQLFCRYIVLTLWRS